MISNIQRGIVGCLVLIGLVMNAGCVPLIIGAAAGAGGVSYMRGALEQNVDHPIKKVHQAALKGLKDFKIFVKSDELNVHSAVMKGEYPDGKKVQVNIEALTEQASKIIIRVGIMGDEEKSHMILNAIRKKLN